ncbi:DUF2182 domain-containing protein [Halorussus sp. AFM4]|uniref:copper chaperone n=1 Tax=Halorussus sp. AFM4 TaxID=3421651 RepID=UPI003EB8F3C9
MRRKIPFGAAGIPTRVTEVRARIDEQLLDADDVPDVPVAMLTVTLLLWTALHREWLPTPSTAGPAALSDPGVPETMGTQNGVAGVLAYLLLWGVLTSAATYPALIPFVERYAANETGSRAGTIRAAVALLGSYSLTWAATGVVPLAVDALVNLAGAADRFGPVLVGGAAVLAGLYQLTTTKRDALARCVDCSSPSAHDLSVRDAAERGVERALDSIRSTWALFALLVVVGSLNLFWLLAVTAVATLERFAPRREEVAATVGAAAVLAGTAIAVAGALGA